MSDTEGKRGPGRPDTYTDEIGQAIYELMAEGYSVTAAAGQVGIGRSTVYLWETKHPEFMDILNLARSARLFFWEKRLRDSGMPGPQITAAIFALKNADRKEWRDQQQMEHTGKDGGPIETAAVTRAELRAEAQRRGLPGNIFADPFADPDESA